MGPYTDTLGKPLVAGRQLDFTPFTTTLWAWLSRQILTQQRMQLANYHYQDNETKLVFLSRESLGVEDLKDK